MLNQTLRAAIIVAGGLVASYFILHFLAKSGHSVANVAGGLKEKF